MKQRDSATAVETAAEAAAAAAARFADPAGIPMTLYLDAKWKVS